VLELRPNFAPAFRVLGTAYQRAGRYDEAIRAHQRAAELNLNFKMDLAHTYFAAGRQEEGEKTLLEIDDATKQRFSVKMARIHAALGQIEEAFQWLERAYEEREIFFLHLEISPEFDPIRDDPRYTDLLHRMNFPE
jgi:tetratricopeptide (TPR) repeat protein